MTIKQKINHGAIQKVCPLHNGIFHSINPIQDGLFRGCSRMGGGGGVQKGSLSLNSVTYILQW